MGARLLDVQMVSFGLTHTGIDRLWQYDFINEVLEIFTFEESPRHATSKFKLNGANYKQVARGCILKDNGYNYLLIYTPGYSSYSNEMVMKLKNRLRSECTIDFVIDESGFDLEG